MKMLADGLTDLTIRKPMPRVVEKKLKRAAIERERIAIKGEVFYRDGGRCRSCGAYAMELHELQPRGAGGARSRFNSIAVCNFKGNNCHRLLQVHVIQYAFLSEIGADGPIRFRTSQRAWTSEPRVLVEV